MIVLIFIVLYICKKNNFVSDQNTSNTVSQQSQQDNIVIEDHIKDDIKLAISYVEEKRDNGSSVSYSYDASNTKYSKLNNTQQELYNEMLPKVQNMIPFEYTAKEYGYDILDNVLVATSALCDDYPLYGIYFDILEVIDGDVTSGLKSSYFLPSDPESKDLDDTTKIKKEVQTFEAECNYIVSAIPENFSTYDKYRFLAAVISISTSYDHEFTGGKLTSSGYGAIAGPTSICSGYSKGFEYLCQKANLWCKQVSGISHEEAHAWNLVKLESGTYHVDITWADDDQNITLSDDWQKYFMLTQSEILTDHEIDDGTVATGTPLK